MPSYEPPTIRELGSIADFTRGDGILGDHDNFTFTTPWGWEISIDYGPPPTS